MKLLVNLNKACKNTFCRRDYGLKENDSCVFCRRTIPAFNTGDLKGSYNYRAAFINLTLPYLLIHLWFFKAKQMILYRESNRKLSVETVFEHDQCEKSRVTVVDVHDVWSHGINTYKSSLNCCISKSAHECYNSMFNLYYVLILIFEFSDFFTRS